MDQLRPREANAVGDSTAGEIPRFQSPDSNVELGVTPIPESSAEEEAEPPAMAEVENEQPEQSLERDQSDQSYMPETSETAGTQAEGSHSAPRRSTRERHPPERFEQQVF